MAAGPNLPKKEGGHIEFKERLSKSLHLKGERRQQLATQLISRLFEGRGVALYVLGVNDDGEVVGLNDLEVEESISVLNSIANECGAKVERIDRYSTESGWVVKVLVKSLGVVPGKHVMVAIAGHVNHGKSTLIACLMTGRPDDGNSWLYLDTLPHEIERRLSADLHFAVIGFKAGSPVLLNNPLDKSERSRLVEDVDKVVSLVDTVGHLGFLSTTLRGLTGQEIDYGVLVVAADDGPTQVTKEHLGVMLALGVPVIICITKTDLVSRERLDEVREEVARVLKRVGRVPFHLKSLDDVQLVIDKLNVLVPIIETSAITLNGYDRLYSILSSLTPRPRPIDKPFLLYIDKIYEIDNVGPVVSGSVKQGRLIPGRELLIGPFSNGLFKRVKTKSIETHHARLMEALPGLVVGIALRGVKRDDVKRGMVLCDVELNPTAVWRFEAETIVLGNPTRLSVGYEPVIHCHTIVQSVRVIDLEKEYLRTGEEGLVKYEFKYSPALIFKGDRFVLREGRTKGIGTVTRILE
ncbi:MAG: GTP-binding protein [Aigarchaeota archaeon]|nr:GTP-binding protein [Aigarchaeota archaeon]MDW8092587.1 GTP-binding protein [Nitrososphaerota archaeon]